MLLIRGVIDSGNNVQSQIEISLYGSTLREAIEQAQQEAAKLCGEGKWFTVSLFATANLGLKPVAKDSTDYLIHEFLLWEAHPIIGSKAYFRQFVVDLSKYELPEELYRPAGESDVVCL